MMRLLVLLISAIFLTGFSKAPHDEANIVETPVSINVQIPLDISAALITEVRDTKTRRDLLFYIIRQYAKYGHIEKAEYMINNLPDSLRLHRKELYALAFCDYYAATNVDIMKRYLADVDGPLKTTILEKCIEKAISLDRFEDAQAFFNLIESSTIQSRNALVIFKSLLEKKRIDEAKLYFSYIVFPAQLDQAWVALSMAYAKANDVKSLEKSLENISSSSVKEELYFKLVEVLSERSNYYLAYSYAENINRSQYHEDALLFIIKALVNDQRYQDAVRMSQSMTKNDTREKAILYLGISFARQGQFDSIDNALAQLETDNLRYEYIETVSMVLLNQDYVDEAIDLSDGLPLDRKITLRKQMAYELGLDSDFHFSLLLIQSFNESSLRSHALAEFALGLADSEQIDKAYQVINLIEDKDVVEATATKILLTAIVDEKENEFKALISSYDAHIAYYQRLVDSDLLTDDEDKTVALKSTLKRFLKKKKLNRKQRFEAQIILMNVYHLLDDDDGVDEALQALHKQLKNKKYEYDIHLYRTVIKELIMRDDMDKAIELLALYPNKDQQLFMMDVFPNINELSEKDKKSFEDYQQRYIK